jgi:hypothetical protein
MSKTLADKLWNWAPVILVGLAVALMILTVLLLCFGIRGE